MRMGKLGSLAPRKRRTWSGKGTFSTRDSYRLRETSAAGSSTRDHAQALCKGCAVTLGKL